jgi:ArsR family transcriptional regulator
MTLDSNLILDILGNDTRRKILSILADEPMYFNQLAKAVDIGQQAMLRHLEALEKGGLIETYGEKSDFGAPNRKYFKLSSAFTLTISLSEDDFLVSHQETKESGRDSKNISKKLDLASKDTGVSVSLLQTNLKEVNDHINNLETQLSGLRARRQNLLRRLHEIGTDRFENDERKVLYMLVRESPQTFSELSELLDEKESVLKALVAKLRSKLQGESDSLDLLDNL